ncbi:hypothetical protein, partial [Shimia sp. SDUM112013]|uniref:hypothetical protein n=1 Tax=Shimia sp. SDUM112013 TaxID=3136160 RepID=UPI0032EF3F75
RRSVWRPVVRLSAAGEGGSTVTAQNPQVLFSHFCKKLLLKFETSIKQGISAHDLGSILWHWPGFPPR